MTKSLKDLKLHKDDAVRCLDCYLEDLLSGDGVEKKKADKLSYWLVDWSRFLKYEPNFNSRSLKRYKKGEIIKVHLGFNVGSEEGGLHYAVVIDNDNKLSDPTVRIVPLTSVKPGKDINELPAGCVFLGDELFTSLSQKINVSKRNISTSITEMTNMLSSCEDKELLNSKIVDLKKDLDTLSRMTREIGKMKKGSIALVNQITTISKIRIYDPKTNDDILGHIKLSTEKLNAIDEEICRMFVK